MPYMPERNSKTTTWILLGAALFGLLLTAVLLSLTERAHFTELERIGAERLNLYASTVESAHRRFDYLPFIAAQDHQVQQLLKTPGRADLRDAVNRKLESWQAESASEALYLMDANGLVVASSNWAQPLSFVGKNYHFRPYFTEASQGRSGRFFAVGVTTGRPGLFLSRPVLHQGRVLGVAVLKIDMTPLEANWAAGGENVWISDSDGVIFLASNPAWRYRSLAPLSDVTLRRLQEAQKYSLHPIRALALEELAPSPRGNRVIRLGSDGPAARAGAPSGRYLLHQRPIEQLGWKLYYLSDLKTLSESKRYAVLVAFLITALLAVLGLFLSSRLRHQQQLEQRVAQRTEALNQSNAQLKQEIDERIRAEQALRQTHEELIQAEKMAALGQLSAGLVHEISQPLSAIQTFLASTRLLVERGHMAPARENLGDIDGLIRRVSAIVTHLKSFASKSRGTLSSVDLSRVVEHALLVLGPSLAKSNIEVSWTPPAPPVAVRADEIKLEQILVNLLRNAIDAIQADAVTAAGKIDICLSAAQGHAQLRIRDNGCGVDPGHLPKLFDPFFTTKPPGQGMGLGLSVSFGIVEEFGGRLEVEPQPGRGTTFCLTLVQAELAHV
ncbi:ATP-binding protein [Motiliproteus sp. SC1-56]|uniref:sensor histidine kinase n=1 Tax=Motiliproteus sp. SC1-56 TaxID=2799565 RepID=UPI001A8ED160|nr:ATP-binding protein [Motiliproteus sp. SC1-56]